jgi:hypothetical protein
LLDLGSPIANLCVQDGEGAGPDLSNVKSQSGVTLTPGFFQPGLTITDAMRSHFVDIKVGTETKLVMGHGYKDSVSISSRAGEPKIVLFGVNQKPVWSCRMGQCLLAYSKINKF